MPTYITGDGDDAVTASDRNDLIQTNGGNDTIAARRGNDLIYAGDGSDFVDAGDGSDVVYAGEGEDFVDAGAGRDVVYGEAGNDEVHGGGGDDTIRGGADSDTLFGEADDDDVDGGSGSDYVDGGSGNDRLFGGANDDQIYTGTGSDVVYGGSGSDWINAFGGSAGDRIYGDGYESLDDFLAGNPVTTDFGNDTIGGSDGHDTIYGDSGLDGVGGGADSLFGGAGNDKLYGEGGDDYLDGGEGSDTLRGGQGDDILVGGSGADQLTGGAGRDRFVLLNAAESILKASDRIADFIRGDDRIDFRQLPELFDHKLAWGGTTPTAGGVWYRHASGQTQVFASTNADTVAELRIVLDGILNLAPTDFWGVVGDSGPPSLGDDSAVLAEDGLPSTTGSVLFNDLGEADLHVTSVRFGATTGTLGSPLQGQYGSLVLDSSGSFTYTLDASSAATIQALGNEEFITEVFAYSAADVAGSSTANLTVSIFGIDDAPTSSSTSIVTNENASVSGALPAATDVEGDAITYSLVGAAAHGTAVVNADGSYSYTPNAGFIGEDSFAFRVDDGWTSNDYSVDVTVLNVNEAPFVANYGVPAGIVVTPIGPGQSSDSAGGMVIQPDGKILLAGLSTSPSTGQDFSLARYNADGSFDPTFGNGGVVITPIGFASTFDQGTGVALQSDGKVLVAGFTVTGRGTDFAVVRYNANGTLDTSFGGGDGIAITAVGAGIATDQALHLAVQSDGKIVLVGSTQSVGVPPSATGQDTALVRYNGDGSLDTTFGAGGIVITPVAPGTGTDAGRAVLAQPDGGILVAGSAFFSATGDDFALVRYTATGALDTTFGGGDGIVTTAVIPFADSARSILQQGDGKIVIAGAAGGNPNSPNSFALARYNADGSLDTTFGNNGVVTTAIGTGSSSGTSVALQADGKLLVAGVTSLSLVAGNDFAIIRYNQNGSVDTTFGTNGVVVTVIGPNTDTPNAISVQADGKIVLAGNTLSPTGTLFDFALARYNPDGSLDATFRAEQRLVANEEGAYFSYTVPADRFADPDGDALTYTATQSDGSALPAWLFFEPATRSLNGTAPAGSPDVHVRVTATDPDGLSASYAYWINTNAVPTSGGTGFVTTNLSSPLLLSDQANDIALQADGKLVAVGLTGSPSSPDLAVVRYTADGSIDLGFGGGDGIVTISLNPGPSLETARGTVVQPDGRIIVAGTTSGAGSDIVLSRLNADGTFDTSFGGGDGIVTTEIAAPFGNDTGNSVTLQADGKILVSGMSNGDLTLVRYHTDGSLDTTFDLDGIAFASTGPANDEGLSVKTQADGKIVVAGYTVIGAGSAFLVARFNVDGSRDATFGTNGIVTTDITAGSTPIPPFQEAGQALAILPDGRILVVGQAPTATSPSDIAVVRYLSNGSLDPSFGTGGIVTTAAGTAQETGFAVALQPDGRIVVVGGNFTPTGGPNIAVLRYNADGSLDSTFGGSGIVTTSIATGLGGDQGLSVALQPDGRIVVGGLSFSPNGPTTASMTNDFTLVRYNPDGTLDTTFGGIGNPSVEVGKAFAWTVPPRAFVDADTDTLTFTIAKADGTPLPAWLTFNGTTLTGTPPAGTTDLALLVTATDPWGAAAQQLLFLNVESPNHAPVVNYAVPAGIVQTPIGPGMTPDVASGLVVQPDGKIIMGGTSTSNETNQDFSLVRYNADGSLDTTFGGDGVVITPVSGASTDMANSVALQADGKIVVAGFGAGPDFALVRYNADGSLDTTFGGGDGIVATTVAAGFARDEALRVTVQSDGKIVVVGYAQNAPNFPPPPSTQFADIAVARYNADGSLDAAFGTGGIVKTEIGTGALADVAQAVLVQADGGIVIAGYTTSTTTAQDFALVRYTASGALDTTFGGGDGIVITAVTPSSDQARSILQQPDGRIVVVGHALTGSDFALARYNVDGTPDMTFGTNGVVVHSVSAGTDSAAGVVLQADGKLLVGGSAGTDFAVVRYNVNGTVDTTFGINGVVTTSISPGVDVAVGVALQADGKIVVGGHAQSLNGPQDFALVRYNANGSLDATFRAEESLVATKGTAFVYSIPADRFVDPDGDALTFSAMQTNGSALPSWLAFDAATRTFSGTAPAGSSDVHVRVTAVDPAGLSASNAYWIHANTAPEVVVAPGVATTNIAAFGTSLDNAAALALQPDGKILLTGSTTALNDTPVVRYNADGSLDLSFGGGDGIVTINTNPSAFGSTDVGRSVAVQADGRIVVAGNAGGDIAVSRLDANGSLDLTFGGGDGIAVTNIPGGTVDTVQSMTLQADGKILVTGKTILGTENQLVLLRHNVDGSLDTAFDADGIVIADVGLNADEGYSVKTQADGKIVVSGYGAVGPEHSILVARFNTNGSFDSSFGGDGIVTTDIGPGIGGFPPSLLPAGIPFESGQALAIQADGRIVVAGFGPSPAGRTDVALVRYNSDGSLDTTFGTGGVVTTAVSAPVATVDRAVGVALQADGRIVVSAAVVTADRGGDIGVLRYSSDGTLDATFGSDGIVTVAISSGMNLDQANGVAIQADGRIVVGATTNFGSVASTSLDFAAVRLNADGSLDTTFGGIGSPVVNAGQPFSWTVQRFFTDADSDVLTYSLTKADGSALPPWATFNGTVLSGTAPTGAPDLPLRLTATDTWGASAAQDFVLRVESPNAAPVVNYAVPAGIVVTPIGPGNSADLATGIVVQANGKIVVVGQSSTAETSQDFTVVRYDTDGSFDTTFGGDGIVVTPAADIANAVAVQADGKLVVAGFTAADFGVVRYNLDGSLDTTFSGDGVVTTAIGPGFSRDEALSVTVQSDGKIVVVGYAQNSTAFPAPTPPLTADIAVVRYNPDGSLDTTFGGGDGVLTTPIGAGVLADVAHDVLVQPDGGIVVAGYTASTGLPNMISDFALVRYTASGALDTTFGGGDGIVTTAIGPASNADQARSILQLPDGRIVVAGFAGAPNGSSDFVLARYNTDGSLDATFGTGGILVHSISAASIEQATSIVRQGDGKLLVTGRANLDFAIARYNENGTVDNTFGANGVITTTVGAPGAISVGIALQADGKIVVNGHASTVVNGNFDFALVRYNADGSLDPTFRAEERVVATEGRQFAHTIPADRFVDAEGDALTFSAAQTNGDALPSWLSFDASTRTFSGTVPAGSGDVHVRVTATDPAGLSASDAYWIYTNTAPNVVVPSGVVSTNIASPFGLSGSDIAGAISVQADGKILLTGSTSAISDTPVVRLNTDGSLDLGFSNDGVLTINTITGGIDSGRSIITQPDGRILIASNSGSDISVTRIFADGFALDGSFGGGDGIATTNIPGGSADFAQSMTLQADGKILVSGRTTVGAENQLVVVRHNVDGTLDPTFDGDGVAIVPIAMNVDDGFSIKTQADGKIVVSGYGATSAVEHSIVVARFNANGSLDTSFDGDGIVTTDIGAGPGSIPIIPNFTFSEAGQGVAIQSDGRIVVAGYAPTPSGGTDIALVRYNIDGSLDATFGTGGVVTTAVSADLGVDRAFGVALQSDGRIVVAGGVVTAEGGQDVGVLRYNVDGTLDTTFGGDGIVTVAIGPGQQTEITTSIAIQPDGRIVVAGSTQFLTNGGTAQDMAVVRLNTDGSLDTTFGGIGAPVVTAGQQFSWIVQRFIADADTDTLTYSMTKADGSPLPAGLTFTGPLPTGSGGALSGTIAAGTGDLALRLTATDTYGAEASQYFVLHVNDPLAPPDDGDTFAFDDGFGDAMVTGFTAGDASGDVLDLSAMTNPEWTDFADIMALTTQVGDNALIDLGDGNSITLIGVTKASLTADDFHL
ncbi:MAG TPA: putative Ig domain-containing protein [Gammaproteobacteria bacterium]|nr:putative Ig domain-containing protein [Gammaproteobacteria bacterium]